MFNLFKKKKIQIGSPCQGEVIALNTVNDPTFAQEMIGKGIAVKPTDGKIYSPVNGTVSMIFPTLHAVGLQSEEGVELLVHVGIDTVNLKGEGFKGHVQMGDTVKMGDLLLEADLDAIKNAGYDTVIPVVVTNTPDFKSIEGGTGKSVQPKDTIMEIEK